jgi:hypothetical protein
MVRNMLNSEDTQEDFKFTAVNFQVEAGTKNLINNILYRIYEIAPVNSQLEFTLTKITNGYDGELSIISRSNKFFVSTQDIEIDLVLANAEKGIQKQLQVWKRERFAE